MTVITKTSFFNRHLPFALSAIILLAAAWVGFRVLSAKPELKINAHAGPAIYGIGIIIDSEMFSSDDQADLVQKLAKIDGNITRTPVIAEESIPMIVTPDKYTFRGTDDQIKMFVTFGKGSPQAVKNNLLSGTASRQNMQYMWWEKEFDEAEVRSRMKQWMAENGVNHGVIYRWNNRVPGDLTNEFKTY